MSRGGWTAAALIAVVTLVVGVPFFTATTFIGDDHIFLTFAHHAPRPWLPFVVDMHGGEYYRPLPMFAWWVLGRLGGRLPFAALALVLHGTASLLVAALLSAIGRPRALAWTAAAFVLIAPQNLDAAYWFAASTDLFAAVFVLAALVAVVRGRYGWAAAAALAAYLSKESAYPLPALALVVAWASGRPLRRRALAALALGAPLAAVLAARTAVLRGVGGSGDARVGLAGKTLQLASGLAHLFTGDAVVPEPLAFGAGAALIAVAGYLAARGALGRRGALAPLALSAVALAPLVMADWAVGARYFYLPGIGIAWLVAEALAGAGVAAPIAIGAIALLLGAVQAAQRRRDVVSYDRRVAAARRAVAAGAVAGHRVFHVDGGVKDLDLAVKEDPTLRARAGEILVLADVPASFAIVPAALAGAAAPLLASPPLPPGGAYRFGDVSVVGLARRGDEPALDEVLALFPDLRFIRVHPVAGGPVIARDVTDDVKAALDDGGRGEQD